MPTLAAGKISRKDLLLIQQKADQKADGDVGEGFHAQRARRYIDQQTGNQTVEHTVRASQQYADADYYRQRERNCENSAVQLRDYGSIQNHGDQYR